MLSDMSRVLALLLFLLLAAGCGGGGGAPTATALPPLTRVAQPTPNFGQSSAPPSQNNVATLTPTTTPTAPVDEGNQAKALRDRLAAELADRDSASTEGNTSTRPVEESPTIGEKGDGNGIVLSQGLNVRAGPGTNYPQVGFFEQNARIEIGARNDVGDWAEVVLPDGEYGWVYAPLIQSEVPLSQLPVSERVRAEPVAEPVVAAAPPESVIDIATGSVSGLSGALVFETSSGGEIYYYELSSGRLRRLTAGSDPALSPDGRTVAFTRGGAGNGVYLINIDGSNERLIFGASAPGSPKWSPDGAYIAFHQQTGKAEPCRLTAMFGCIPQAEVDRVIDEFFGGVIPEGFDINQWPLVEQALKNLSRIDSNGGSYQDLPSLPSVGALDWENWGIVYQSSVGLQFSEDRPDAQTKPLLNEIRFRDPDWQPGGNRIVFMSQEGDHWEIFRANDDGGEVIPLTRPPLFRTSTVHSVAPAWSPDGAWIVFVSNRSGAWRLWVMDSSGGNLQQLPIEIDLNYQFQAEQMVDWGIVP